MNKTISKISLFFVLLSLSPSLFSQGISISSTGTVPSPNAVLDLNTGNANNKGLIIPNVTLGAVLTTFNPPIANAATSNDVGLIVYNSSSTNQPIGYYYWNGSTWVNILSSVTGWSLTGNTGNASGDFIGTTDANPLVFKVNSQRCGRIDYAGSTANTFLGYQTAKNTSGTNNIAIGYQALNNSTTGSNNSGLGYQALTDITTGANNTATGSQALGDNAAGSSNTANGTTALYKNTGSFNTAFGDSALYKNTSGIGNTSAGYAALLANTTGTYNTALGYNATVSTGTLTNATAIGYDATATTSNTMELGNTSLVFTGINGAAYNSSYALAVGSTTSNGHGAYLTIGGTWTNVSNRNLKENFSTPDGEEILAKICALPLFRWNYKNEPAAVQHIGPMAQDFYRIFQVGNDSLSISTIDPAGIALVGVQELNKKLEAENAALKAQINQLTKLAQKQDTRSTNEENQSQSIKEQQTKDEKEIAELKAMINSMNQAQAQASIK